MAMAWIWTVLTGAALLFGLLTGRMDAVASAALEGAGDAVDLCLGIAGAICLWSGLMELMRRSGLMDGLSRLLRPVLIRLFPESEKIPGALDALSINVSANLLGLGNAATPAGIKAAKLLRGEGEAGGGLVRLVVLNTASVQLIPATVCALRASAGARQPFDILPAVWLASAFSVTAGLIAERILRRFFK